jgi:hypothetical protein
MQATGAACREKYKTLSTRHREPTGRANARPMTGSAKQSILSLCREVDCFASLAMTGMGRGVPDNPACVGYDDPLATRKILKARQQELDFTDASHGHVKGRFRA